MQSVPGPTYPTGLVGPKPQGGPKQPMHYFFISMIVPANETMSQRTTALTPETSDILHPVTPPVLGPHLLSVLRDPKFEISSLDCQ